jgi:hypothetical protein
MANARATIIDEGQLEAGTTKFFADLEAVRLSPEDMADFSAREILTRIPVRRPKRKEFVRCHPDPTRTVAVSLLFDDGDGEAYFVAPNMRTALADDSKSTLLQLAMTHDGTLIIWPLTIPNDENPRGRSWHESAMIAKELAKRKWIRVFADRSRDGYRVFEAAGKLPEPEWPKDKTFNELLEIAFADKIIMSEDHPIVRKLRGLV